MTRFFVPALAGCGLLLSGCVASTAWKVATAPVKVAGKVADWTTTSQSESDRNYGRKMRLQEAREGRDRKLSEKECRKARQANCAYTGYRAGDERY